MEILLIGYTNSEKTLTNARGQVRGLPLDVLSAEAFDHYWQQAIVPLLDAAKPYIGKSLRYLVTDSWEAGGTDWTDNFRKEFRLRCGYAPVAYLPIVIGRILSNREMCERFLFDLRRTVADLITKNYYGRFAEHAKKVGLGTHPESGGPHGAPIDTLETFRNSSFPQTEYWKVNGNDVGTVWRTPYDVRIDGRLQADDNIIEIKVSNLWPNRLIGDAGFGMRKRLTDTNVQAYGSESTLLPSGILQPLRS